MRLSRYNPPKTIDKMSRERELYWRNRIPSIIAICRRGQTLLFRCSLVVVIHVFMVEPWQWFHVKLTTKWTLRKELLDFSKIRERDRFVKAINSTRSPMVDYRFSRKMYGRDSLLSERVHRWIAVAFHQHPPEYHVWDSTLSIELGHIPRRDSWSPFASLSLLPCSRTWSRWRWPCEWPRESKRSERPEWSSLLLSSAAVVVPLDW